MENVGFNKALVTELQKFAEIIALDGASILDIKHRTRGMFRPFHAFVSRALGPNTKSQSKYDCHITENYLRSSIEQY